MNKLQKYFGDKEIPQTLKDLYDFDRGSSQEYAKSFHMIPEDDMCEFINEGNELFSSRLIEFAQGGESLSSYALWLHEENCDLENTPVVFMDSDSGPNLIAKDLKDFLRILSYDENCDGDYYYKDCEDYEMSPNHELYVKWLKKHGLEPIKSCNEDDKDLGYDEVTKLTDKVKELYGDGFYRWLHAVNNPDSELVLDNLDTNGIEAEKVNITSIDDCVELLFRPMNDTYLLGAFDFLKIPRPIFDGKYLEKERIYLESEDGSIYLNLEKEDENVLPTLVSIGFQASSSLALPFNISLDDSYYDVSDKIGKKAEFQHSAIRKMKKWILKNNNQVNYELALRFKSRDTYEKIQAIVLIKENPYNRKENKD